MSYKNPNVNDVINNSIDLFDMSKYLHKSYLNIAKYKLRRKLGRKPNLDDAQQLFDIFVDDWRNYYKRKPLLEKLYKEKAKPIWEFGCKIHISVKDSTREFVRSINPEFKDIYDYHYDSWIIRNNKFEEYKDFCIKNKKKFPYRRETYVDYSHLAYNGVANDF